MNAYSTKFSVFLGGILTHIDGGYRYIRLLTIFVNVQFTAMEDAKYIVAGFKKRSMYVIGDQLLSMKKTFCKCSLNTTPVCNHFESQRNGTARAGLKKKSSGFSFQSNKNGK